jgi:hypothetical protein
MTFSKTPLAAAVAMLVLAAAAGGASATTIYDSGGFELPRFDPAPVNGTNDLAGQDSNALLGGQGPWKQDGGTSSAVVQTNQPASGYQSVYVQRAAGATGDTKWWVDQPVTPNREQSRVAVDFDMSVDITATLGNGPLFGVQAYDGSKLIGGVLLDASRGAVLYPARRTGSLTETGTYLSRNDYHHFSLVTDFADKTYSIFADDLLLHTERFVDRTAAAFSAAPIVTMAAVDPSEIGKAYFDNYVIDQPGGAAVQATGITAVPEPASASAVAGIAGAAMLVRRSRRRLRRCN